MIFPSSTYNVLKEINYKMHYSITRLNCFGGLAEERIKLVLGMDA